jgi:hypothetical protein
VLTLTVGISASIAIFSVLEAVLLRQLPYRDPERLGDLERLWPRASRFRGRRRPARWSTSVNRRRWSSAALPAGAAAVTHGDDRRSWSSETP